MSDVQITVSNEGDAQVISASLQETQITSSVPGIQGPVGQGFPSGGTTNQVLFKQSNTSYDAVWGFVTSSMIGDLEIVNTDVAANAAIAGTKISPNFGSQNVITTGTNTAASFIPTSSTVPTNGVYLPSANSVAISTGGSGRLFVGPTGQIGISQSSLATGGFTAGTLRIGHSTGQTAGVLLQNTSTAADSSFWYTDGTDSFLGSNNGFFAHYAGGSERLRITSAGLVGIGTSSPVARIHSVQTSAAEGLRVDGADGGFSLVAEGGTTYNTRARQVSIGASYFSNTPPANGLIVQGSVGIGTTSPAQLLHLNSPSANATQWIAAGTGYTSNLSLLANGSGGGLLLSSATDSSASIINSLNAALTFGTNNTERLRITSAGLVGVGTSVPDIFSRSHAQVLGISSTSGNSFAQLNGATGNRGGIEMGAGGVRYGSLSAEAASVDLGTNAAIPLYLSTNNITRVTVDSSGNVGIGTTAPLVLLHVSANTAAGYVAQILENTNATGYAQQIFRIGSAGGSGEATIGYAPGVFFAIGPTSNDTTTPIVFRNNNSQERARIDSSGRLLVGTSSALTGATAQYSKNVNLGNSANASGNAVLAIGRGAAATSISSGNQIGSIYFTDNGAGEFASIDCFADAAPGTNDFPGRLVFSTTADGTSSPTERLRITSAGLVGVGTSAPGAQTESRITGGGAAPATSGTSQPNAAFRVSGTGTTGVLDIGCNSSAPWIQSTDRTDLSQKYSLLLNPNGGSVGIGTTSPGANLHVQSSAGAGIRIQAGSTSNAQIDLIPGGTSDPYYIYVNNSRNLIFQDFATERARIDSSGRLLVGTSSARTNYFNSTATTQLQIEKAGGGGGVSVISDSVGDDPAILILGKSNNASVGGNTAVAVDNFLGTVSFQGNDGSEFVDAARISCYVDGTPGANDMPGRLVFSTTADGASSPTERLRITSAGLVGVGTSSPSFLIHGLKSSAGTVARFEANGTDSNISVKTSGREGIIGADTSQSYLLNTDAFPWTFWTNNIQRMTITSAGLVGIGTSSPSTLLTVQGDATLRVASGNVGIGLQTGSLNGSWYLNDADDSLRWYSSTGGDRLTISSSGNVGIGTSSPDANSQLHIVGSSYQPLYVNTTGVGGGGATFFRSGTQALYVGTAGSSWLSGSSIADGLVRAEANLVLSTNGNSRAVTIDTSQRVGIGATSPLTKLDVRSGVITAGSNSSPNGTEILRGYYSDTDGALAVIGTEYSSGGIVIGSAVKPSTSASDAFLSSTTVNVARGAYTIAGNTHKWYIGAVQTVAENSSVSTSEVMRIDSSGRLLVGTSSVIGNNHWGTAIKQQLADDIGGAAAQVTYSSTGADYYSSLELMRARGSASSPANVINGDFLGAINFYGYNSSGSTTNNKFQRAALIRCEVDGSPAGTADDMPGRLVFSTTADGASFPTERMRIGNNGYIYLNTTNVSPPENNVTGVTFQGGGDAGTVGFNRDGFAALLVGRKTDDGDLVRFYQDGTQEGSISVSGTTVSYNGAHLSRWSQLPSGAERNEILRGSVLSNIDEMCEWGEEDNEQLNRMKVSDVEGDKNVAGVFQAWDDDDDTYTNDFYCAMTGDFIIRIGAGITVERGDLLISAGDGTAKPQDDDIIRSKTIAKVTSTNVSCTYDDGSYCVPCVLMAC